MCCNLFRFYEKNEDHPMFLSPSCAQSLCDFRLHGVSHDAASPMPVASNICVVRFAGFTNTNLLKYMPIPSDFPAQWKIPGDRFCIVAES